MDQSNFFTLVVCVWENYVFVTMSFEKLISAFWKAHNVTNPLLCLPPIWSGLQWKNFDEKPQGIACVSYNCCLETQEIKNQKSKFVFDGDHKKRALKMCFFGWKCFDFWFLQQTFLLSSSNLMNRDKKLSTRENASEQSFLKLLEISCFW